MDQNKLKIGRGVIWESVVIPLTTMYRAFGTGEYVDWFVCEAKPGIKVSQMEEKVRSFLKTRHDVAPDDPNGINGFNLEEDYEKISGLFMGINGMLWVVGIFTLLAGVIGISNIMLIIVKERTKEIGLRKALGATPGSIINMIITESVFITSIAGYVGLFLATSLIALINWVMVSNNIESENFYNPQINISVGVISVIVLVISGALAGLIPAYKASRINPVLALKDE